MKIVILNGPNLNLLGRREPAIYGTRSMEQVLLDLQRAYPNVHFVYHQSNHEGDLIDWVQEFGMRAYSHPLSNEQGEEVNGIVINAGGYTHTSVALRDAVACSEVPVVEVHISNIVEREPFRHISLLTDVCQYSVIGQGTDGYRCAVAWILREKKGVND
ncbi:MAG: 3-dehydroquinate dehydratase [Paludibacteraceae bacterium]|jgi:3-dehydroquinate dehydratase-2|nr:3-dehydroquinate dehydratase [Paludibacteraceae bacterium]